jgi:REP element-mobilizing transposase RayT
MNTDVHHLHVRTRNGEPCFDDDACRFMILRLVGLGLGGLVLAFCIMRNHLHLVLEGPKEHTKRWLDGILVQYTRWFNPEHGREGNLFGPVKVEDALTTPDAVAFTIQYVHDNPVKAGIVKCAVEWPWASQRAYDGISMSTIAKVERGLGFCTGSEWRCHSRAGHMPPLMDAGRFPRPLATLDGLVAAAAQTYLVSPADLRGRSEDSVVMTARNLYVQLGVRESFTLRQIGAAIDRSKQRMCALAKMDVPDHGVRIARTLLAHPPFSRLLAA